MPDLPINGLNGWDRTFLDVSSKMAEPFCAAWHFFRFRLVAPLDPGKFENCTTNICEIAFRALTCLGTAIAAFLLRSRSLHAVGAVFILGMANKVTRALGFALQQNGYTHVRGNASEISLNSELKILNWNICGIGGGLSLDHGGVCHWESRLDGIVETILREDADVLILQEVYDTALAESLIKKLQESYAHFFAHLGPNIWGSVGGCMVISKCAIYSFSHTSFKNNDWTLNRGFANLELRASPNQTLPCMRVIGTHLIHGSSDIDQEHRREQIAQIVDHIARQTLSIPTVISGDLNIERDSAEGTLLAEHLQHGYLGSEPTCTNKLVAQWDGKLGTGGEEIIDYISMLKNNPAPTLAEARLVKGFDDSYNTKTALSDHHAISVIIHGMESKTCAPSF